MKTLEFKTWLSEDANATQKIANDPVLKTAQANAQTAVKMAIAKKQDPLKAAQNAVMAANVPTNKLGKIMPKDPDQEQV